MYVKKYVFVFSTKTTYCGPALRMIIMKCRTWLKPKHLNQISPIQEILQYIISFSTDFCLLPPDVGQGTSFTLAVHYDVNKDQCTPFLYNGEGGNANRFENERECITQCREYLPYWW